MVVAHTDFLDTTEECLENIYAVNPDQDICVVLNGPPLSSSRVAEVVYDVAEIHDPVVIGGTGKYELGALADCMQFQKAWGLWDRVLLLQDTFIIHSKDFFDAMFRPKHSVSLNNVYQSYALVYETAVLEQMDIPEIKSKADAVRYERDFNVKYAKLVTMSYVWPGLREVPETVEKWGRLNRTKSVAGIFTKYKGCWGASMIGDAR